MGARRKPTEVKDLITNKETIKPQVNNTCKSNTGDCEFEEILIKNVALNKEITELSTKNDNLCKERSEIVLENKNLNEKIDILEDKVDHLNSELEIANRRADFVAEKSILTKQELEKIKSKWYYRWFA